MGEIKRFKRINCSKCGAECNSGKKGLCDLHYASYIQGRSKKTAKKVLLPFSPDKYSMSNLQILFQKFCRIAGGDYCASCGLGSTDCGGHLIAKAKSKHVAVLVSNIYPQCNNCNSPQGLDGNPKGLMKSGLLFWGKNIMQELLDLARTSYTFNESERKELHEKVTEALKSLEDAVSDYEKEQLRRNLFSWQQEQTWYIN